VIVLPGSMPFRMVVSSGVLEQLRNKTVLPLVVVCPDEAYRKKLPEFVEWRDLRRPAKSSNQSLVNRIARSMVLRVESMFNITYGGLAYRLNEISGFQAHQFKKSMSAERRTREELAGNFVTSRYGFPFSSSGFLYHCLHAIFFRKSYIPDRFIEGFFEEGPVDLLVFWHAQNKVYRDYVQCARSRSIPMIAAIGSWDRTTTKGPLMPGLKEVIAINQVMKSELVKYHGVAENQITVAGWSQMDSYAERGSEEQQQIRKTAFLSKYGFQSDASLIVYAGNSERLGRHEPGVVSHLAENVAEGSYGENVCFFLRPHPQDLNFKDRFSTPLEHGAVHWEDASITDLSQLKELFLCADIVVSTQGSICLDAVAFDRCVINVAFDGDLQPAYEESVQRFYEMDHYQPVLNSGGVSIVNSYTELDQALRAYIADYSFHEKGRANLREVMLEPLDGRSAERIVDVLLTECMITS
jgi:hypothetical protein